MSLIKVAISSAPARLMMQKEIMNTAGGEAGALYNTAANIFARKDATKFKVAKNMLSRAKQLQLQRSNPLFKMSA